MRRRVVITGMGVVTPLGHSVGEMFANLLEGKSGVDRITNFDAHTFPTTFAAQVKQFDLGRFVPRPERYAKCGVNTRFGLAAAHQALADANLTRANVDCERTHSPDLRSGPDRRAVEQRGDPGPQLRIGERLADCVGCCRAVCRHPTGALMPVVAAVRIPGAHPMPGERGGAAGLIAIFRGAFS